MCEQREEKAASPQRTHCMLAGMELVDRHKQEGERKTGQQRALTMEPQTTLMGHQTISLPSFGKPEDQTLSPKPCRGCFGFHTLFFRLLLERNEKVRRDDTLP